MTVDWQRVGKAIEARIDELHLTQAEVQRRAGVSDKTLTGYMRGQPIVRKDKQRGLCDALEWAPESIDRVLAGDEPVVAPRPSNDERLTRVEQDLAETRSALVALAAHLGIPLPSGVER